MTGRYPAFWFACVAATVFVVSVAVTIFHCVSMTAMGEMPMSGGWSMSMTWMRMCGQSWGGVAASFLGMWMAMTIAMMLPSLAPSLWQYGERVSRRVRLVALASAGYFAVWIAAGIGVFALGAALAALAMQWPAFARAVPDARGLVVVMAGAFQCSAWKARHLACCRQSSWPGDAAAAWRAGLHLGLHCNYCCAGLTSILVAIGIMDLRAMVLITAAITAERLAPDGVRIARVTGMVAVVVGCVLIAQAS